MSFLSVFKEENGLFSMRRVLAAFFSVCSIGCGITAIVKSASWQVTAVAFGVPVIAVLFLMFFTTWGDVAAVAKAVKGNGV